MDLFTTLILLYVSLFVFRLISSCPMGQTIVFVLCEH